VAVPVAGLVWYATGRDENWVETLVAAQLPEGAELRGGARTSAGTACTPCLQGQASWLA
jgi:hypothetical protein